jgi:hypothetical protein
METYHPSLFPQPLYHTKWKRLLDEPSRQPAQARIKRFGLNTSS